MKLQERLQELQGRWVKHPSEYPFAAEQTLASIKKDITAILELKLDNEDKMLNTCRNAQDALRSKQVQALEEYIG
jgi:hypothetical protein